MGKIRGTHSSPGVYTKFTDLSYAAKTLGVTTLGIAGETLKGPAFEPILINDFNQFRDYFGGTSAEKFKDSQYPKYQLPYIAKSYLTASDRLYVCRVLGLSGYNAGPAFLITATDTARTETYVIAVLRSRGTYKKYANFGTECNPVTKYDTLQFACDKVTIEPYTNVSVVVNCGAVTANTETTETYPINALNYGQFTIVAHKYIGVGQKLGDVYADAEGFVQVGRYPVSLNAGTKDYIYDVLGSRATDGTAAVFVEELYDVMLESLIARQKVSQIGGTEITGSLVNAKELTKINELVINAVADPVRDFVNIPETSLSRKQLGQTFICVEDGEVLSGDTGNGFTYHELNEDGTIADEPTEMEVGHVYIVTSNVSPIDGGKVYVYTELLDEKGSGVTVGTISSSITADTVDAVKVLEYDSFVCLNSNDEVVPLTDISDYHDQFRCASTPWAVSELKGDGKNLQVKKLFRFHTISDGTESNTEVKVSIANIRPDDGRFDVYVRDFGDSDGNVTILESYKNLTMVPGDPKYIGLQIGTLDGAYEAKSKYIMVEIIEDDMTKNCVPCGFLGYPVRDFSAYQESGNSLIEPSFTYNTIYDDDIKPKRQYFGLSDLYGIDADMLAYKGKNAYTDEYTHGYTHPFHLDSTLSDEVKTKLGQVIITIDGDMSTSSITWDCVSVNNTPVGGSAPVMGSETDMEDTIYANKALRKFTMCFYGGFDGWDIYRNSRTNTDDYKASRYKGTIINGYGQTFSKIQDGTNLALEGNCITSDYYAYQAAYNQFEIPEKYVINLFATPGIDYVNNTMLVDDALDMIEEKRQDTLYVIDTPDKPWGASDAIDEMYSSAEAAENLEDVGIDTYYACTYYPWVKYFDSENNIFINLPATKDVLRNMADVDNKKFPWYAPAGIERGKVECTRMHFFAKLEDEDNVYDGRINPLKTFSQDGVKIWGNKTMYTADTPMNRVNTVRLMLYMRKLIIESTRVLLFEPNDTTLKAEFEDIVNPILAQIKRDRGITDYRLDVEQTPEMMDAHEIQCKLWVKPTPTLEYIEIEFMVTPQGVEFSSL